MKRHVRTYDVTSTLICVSGGMSRAKMILTGRVTRVLLAHLELDPALIIPLAQVFVISKLLR